MNFNLKTISQSQILKFRGWETIEIFNLNSYLAKIWSFKVYFSLFGRYEWFLKLNPPILSGLRPK
jgi:hypothetical protein